MTKKETGMGICFACPYHSWERVMDENNSGLLRQFFPKRRMFAKPTQEDADKTVKLINNRPK